MNVLLFDYDGTIADSSHLAIALIHFIHEKYGTPDCTSMKEMLPFYENNFFDYLLTHGMKKERMPELLKDLDTFLAPRYNEAPCYDGMPSVLKKLAKKYVLYVITSGHTAVIQNHLKKEKINTLFKDVLGADKGVHKTDKINMVKKLHPNATLYYIGDTTGDIREGKKTGVKTIAVTWGTHTKEMLQKEQPDKLVNTPQELLDYLYSLHV